jgi:hypothetical protein
MLAEFKSGACFTGDCTTTLQAQKVSEDTTGLLVNYARSCLIKSRDKKVQNYKVEAGNFPCWIKFGALFTMIFQCEEELHCMQM